MKKLRKKILEKNVINIFFLLFFFALIIFLWELVVNRFHIPERIIPKPSGILAYMYQEFFTNHSESYVPLFQKTLQSLSDALIGFVISISLGTVLGFFFAINKIVEKIFSPILFVIQLLPTPAFAPVIAAILGYGLETKIVIIVLFTIFPVVAVISDKIKNIPKNYYSLLNTYNASIIQRIITLILPGCVPDLFSLMKVLITASFVASIISELPLTVSNGIGKDIYISFNNQVICRVWTSLFLISVTSLFIFLLVAKIEKYILNKYKYGSF